MLGTGLRLAPRLSGVRVPPKEGNKVQSFIDFGTGPHGLSVNMHKMNL